METLWTCRIDFLCGLVSGYRAVVVVRWFDLCIIGTRRSVGKNKIQQAAKEEELLAGFDK